MLFQTKMEVDKKDQYSTNLSKKLIGSQKQMNREGRTVL